MSLGDDVRVYGTVTQDAVSLGGDILIESGGTVDGDVVSLGGDITVRNGSRVKGNVVTFGGRVIVELGGSIDGKKISLTPNLMPFYENITGVNFPFETDFRDIGYQIVKMIVFWPLLGVFGLIGVIFGIVFVVLKLVLFISFSIIIIHFFPENVSNMACFVKENFFKSVLWGFLVSFLLPFVIVALIITIVGIPTVPPLLVLIFFSYLYGSVGLALMAGRLLPGSSGRSEMMNVCLGVFLLMFLRLIPGLGFILKLIFFAASLGLVIYTRFGTQRNNEARI